MKRLSRKARWSSVLECGCYVIRGELICRLEDGVTWICGPHAIAQPPVTLGLPDDADVCSCAGWRSAC